MKQNGIYLFLSLLAIAICVVIVVDFNASRDKKKKGNPYALDLTPFQTVDPSLIHYREVRNIQLNCETPKAIHYDSGRLFIVADRFLQVIDPGGVQQLKVDLPEEPNCVYSAPGGKIYIAYPQHIAIYDRLGNHLNTWETLGEKAVITALAMKDSTLYAADAGNRCVVRYSTIDGKVLGIIEGKTQLGALHGFVVPSPTFDLGVNADGELWVVNPGRLAFENYTDEGQLRTFWERTSPDIEGFTGCCNPAHIAILPDGSFVTSEKHIVRIKVHKPSGELASVVAPPSSFKEEGMAPDITVSPEGIIYALDLDRKMVRIFEKKSGI